MARTASLRAARQPKQKAPTEPLPETIAPQLATLATRAPTSGDWTYEIKFDGYRFMARLDAESVRLFTRNQFDWTNRLPRQAKALASLSAHGVQSAWFDGEMVCLNEEGLPDFGEVQTAMSSKRTTEVVYFVFDLLFLNGTDLRPLPLVQRRAQLSALMTGFDIPELRFSEDFPHDAHDILANACKLKLEGVVGKMADAPYTSGPSQSWIKLKCRLRQEFVLGGFTSGSGAAANIKSLLLGVYDDEGLLKYAGSVALTGKAAHVRKLETTIRAAAAQECPFFRAPKQDRAERNHWLEPELVAEVAFMEWTRSGTLRQPSFVALRTDKAAESIHREVAVNIEGSTDAPSAPPRPSARRAAPPLKLTHPERVLDPSTGFTKLDLANYYAEIAQAAIPHLKDRPVALVRAPSGITGEMFFPKHSGDMTFPSMNLLPPELYPRHEALLNINSPAALAGAVQMGTIELHTWNASQPDLARPDRVIFDLDPDVSLDWKRVQEAALLTKVVLDEIGLKAWLKTSGGKGFHIVVPLEPELDWATVKAFSHAVARHMAKVLPAQFSATSGPKNRVGKVFVDYLRNGKAQSTAAAFSARARPGLGVSIPIAWGELEEIRSADQWNIRSAVERISRLRNDPWKAYWTTRQSLTAEMIELLE